MMMHPVCRGVGPVGLLLGMICVFPVQGGAQAVSMESLMATADSGLAAARAGAATAALKLALVETEAKPAAGESLPVEAAPSATAVQAPEADPLPEADLPHVVSPDDSAAAAAASDRLNALLPAPLLAQAVARADSAGKESGLDGEAAAGGPDDGAPGALDAAGAIESEAEGVPLTDLVGATLESGLAGAASLTSDWTTLFRGLVDRHPGLMPALLLLMTAAGATVLAMGAGIRPARRRRADVGHEGNPSDPGSARHPRTRPDQRVPRDVAAVLASLEGRRGASPLYGRDPRDGTAPRRHG